jgi:8-oxo-dGTP pyrophosphatase MutT (NUDIX family)
VTEDAIPAATLIVVRDRPGLAPELLLVERAEGMAFAAGALVFPGGRIDDPDQQLAMEIGDANGAVVAAIRETVEETAIPVGLSPTPDRETALRLQRQLLPGGDFGELTRGAGFEIQPFALIPFARWVPKFHAVRRFDTMFYVAACPPGEWEPNAIPGECSGAYWLSAAEVLDRDRRGEARLIFPTRRNLERLAQFATFDEIRADALAHPIEPVTPWVEERGGEKFITIPGHLGYPVTEERLDGLWRG